MGLTTASEIRKQKDVAREGESHEIVKSHSWQARLSKIGSQAASTHFQINLLTAEKRNMLPGRWSIFIDVEGFSAIYGSNPGRALFLLSWLTQGVYRIASAFPRFDQERLFIHQMGDGFVIVSDFPETDFGRPLSVAAALMQYMLPVGGVARTGVSAGDFSDIIGCLPDEVRKALDECNCLDLPNGLMHVFPVMGDALIKSYKVQTNGSKGPLLFVDPELRSFTAGLGLKFLRRSTDRVIVDWVNSDPPMIVEAFDALKQPRPPKSSVRSALEQYTNAEPVNARWRRNAERMFE